MNVFTQSHMALHQYNTFQPNLIRNTPSFLRHTLCKSSLRHFLKSKKQEQKMRRWRGKQKLGFCLWREYNGCVWREYNDIIRQLMSDRWGCSRMWSHWAGCSRLVVIWAQQNWQYCNCEPFVMGAKCSHFYRHTSIPHTSTWQLQWMTTAQILHNVLLQSKCWNLLHNLSWLFIWAPTLGL